MDKKRQIDIVNEILEQCIIAYPVSSFIIGLYQQYQQRGSLSKKQLQGLYGKASEIIDMVPGKLATLEALINKMPNRFKSEIPAPKPMYEKDENIGIMISTILEKYPQHKRVLFLKSKFENNETLNASDLADLERFHSFAK